MLPSEETTWFPGCSILFSKLDLAVLQCPPSPFREEPTLKDSGGVGAGDCIHFPYPGAGSPASNTVYYGSRDTEQSPISPLPLKPIRFTQQGEVGEITVSPFSPADSNLLVFIAADKETNHLVSKSKPRNQSHSLSTSCILRGDSSRKDQSSNTLSRLQQGRKVWH